MTDLINLNPSQKWIDSTSKIRPMTAMESMGYMDPPCGKCEEAWDRGIFDSPEEARHQIIDHGLFLR